MEILVAVICVLGLAFMVIDRRRRSKKLEELSKRADALDKEGFVALNKEFELTRKEMRIYFELFQKRFNNSEYRIAVNFNLQDDFNLTFDEIKDLLNDMCIKTIVWTPKTDHFESFKKQNGGIVTIEDTLRFFKWWKVQVVELQ